MFIGVRSHTDPGGFSFCFLTLSLLALIFHTHTHAAYGFSSELQKLFFSLSSSSPSNEELMPAAHQQVCLNSLLSPFVSKHVVACTYLGGTPSVMFWKSVFVLCYCYLFWGGVEWRRGVRGGARPVARDTLLTHWLATLEQGSR